MLIQPNFVVGSLGPYGTFYMFRLSDKRIWLLSHDEAWEDGKGSYIYEEGIFWPGFKPPQGVTKFSGFSIVQLDDNDKFFISGGVIDGAPSTKAYIFDSLVMR